MLAFCTLNNMRLMVFRQQVKSCRGGMQRGTEVERQRPDTEFSAPNDDS